MTWKAIGEDDPKDQRDEKVSRIARRLGVEPVEPGTSYGMGYRLNDGTTYDVFALMEAFLDRLDGKAEHHTTDD